MSKTPEGFNEFIVSLMIVGGAVFAFLGFLLALGWMTISEVLQCK
jgi:hypothetical protein